MKKHSKIAKIESAKKAAGNKQQDPRSDLQQAVKELSSDSRVEGVPLVDANKFYVGIDLGDKRSYYCILNPGGGIVVEGTMATTEAEIEEYASLLPKSRIAVEVGTHSAWVSERLEGCGHEVFVANPRRMESIHKNKRKNDKVDARTLARLVRADPELLYPIRHRGAKARNDLVLLRARDSLVATRTKLINCVRGLVKSVGGRVPKCSAESFHKSAKEALPENVRKALLPLVDQIATMTATIRDYDEEVERMAKRRYPETEVLRQPRGVGALTALAYVLTLENPKRFGKSRDVGPYLGLVPRQDDSGESSKQLRITKTGDGMVRRLLVGCAHYMLGPFGEDSDLRRHGLKIAARGGKNAKKRAVTAVARKLSVLLHHLWLTGEEYEPLRNVRLAAAAAK
jgi:transposase